MTLVRRGSSSLRSLRAFGKDLELPSKPENGQVFQPLQVFTTYGFHPDDPDRLVDAIYHHPETGLITQLPADEFGQRWIVVGPIVTPDGRNPVMRTGWIKHGSGPPRFVTAIPKAG
ncbi:UNVERIFIED_CONTAM: hypothetical protein Q9R58_08170 [Methylobacteriaceae bacterium AG10]|nr:hypothetical protein [Methylobacteriaceae bacterium AG10]